MGAADSSELFDAPRTERDWQADAWRRLQQHNPARHPPHWTLEQALADELLGRIVRAFARQLEHDRLEREERRRRELRFGRQAQRRTDAIWFARGAWR